MSRNALNILPAFLITTGKKKYVPFPMILAKLFSDNIAKVTQMGCKENIFICFEADLKVEDHLGLYNSDDGIDDIGSGGDWMGEDDHSGCGEEEDYWNPARWGQT